MTVLAAIADPTVGAPALFRPARVCWRLVQGLLDPAVGFSSAARPPVMIHLASDGYSVEDVQERPRLISSPALAYTPPLLRSRVASPWRR